MPQRKFQATDLMVPLLVAAILGGVEMRVAVSRLSAGHDETTRRLDRIERLIDAHRLAQKDDD